MSSCVGSFFSLREKYKRIFTFNSHVFHKINISSRFLSDHFVPDSFGFGFFLWFSVTAWRETKTETSSVQISTPTSIKN